MGRIAPLLIALVLALAGCGVAPFTPRATGVQVVLEVRPASAYQTLAIAHRWTAADVYQYDLRLKIWNGGSFVDPTPAVALTLPQKGPAPRTSAVLQNLRHGARYQVSVLARGNVGGTAPTTTLNALVPCVTEFTFGATQDVGDALVRSLQVTLDPAPFSGTLTIVPSRLPAGTTDFALELSNADTGAALFSGTYSKGGTMVIQNARFGIRYTIALTAMKKNGAAIKTATSAVVYFDPAGQDIEQAITVPIAF